MPRNVKNFAPPTFKSAGNHKCGPQTGRQRN